MFAEGPIGPQGPIPCSSTGPRGTALYDAVYLASHDELSHEVGRKAMILLTDGEDQGSRLKIKDAIEAAQKADAICYVLLIADRGFYGFGGYSGDSEMRKLTQETGGRMIEVGQQDRQAAAGLRPDCPGTAQPVQHRLHAHQHQPGWQLPQSGNQTQAGRLQDPGAQRVLCGGAAGGLNGQPLRILAARLFRRPLLSSCASLSVSLIVKELVHFRCVPRSMFGDLKTKEVVNCGKCDWVSRFYADAPA